MIPAYVWGLMAGVPAVAAEYLYRVWPGTWASHLWAWLPISLTISYAIYRMVTIPGSNLLDAFIIWALCTAGLRLFVTTMLLHDQIKTATWIAFGLILLANVVKFVGSK